MSSVKHLDNASLEFSWFGEHCLNKQTTGKSVFIEGQVTVICVYNPSQAILMTSVDNGVCIHPRSGPLKGIGYTITTKDIDGIVTIEQAQTTGIDGGWEDGTKKLDTSYVYPLVDDDNATFLLSSQEEGVFCESFGNYGNLYWTNDAIYDAQTKEYDKEFVVLSWKGTPTRHFRLPDSYNLDGLSIIETEDTSEFKYYTTFNTVLYQDGLAIFDSPKYSWPLNGTGVNNRALILGASQSEKNLFIVTLSDRNQAPDDVDYGDEKRSVEKLGYFLMLWKDGNKVDGWEIVYEERYTKNGLPWFADNTGENFVCGNGDKLSISSGIKKKQIVYGTTSEEKFPDGSLSFRSSYNDERFFEYLGNDIVSCPFTLYAYSNTSGYHGVENYQDWSVDAPIVVLVPETEALTLSCDVVSGASIGKISVTGGAGALTFYKKVGAGEWQETQRSEVVGQDCGSQEMTDACAVTENIYYKVTDSCSGEGLTSLTYTQPDCPSITITGPRVWTNDLADYTATGGCCSLTKEFEDYGCAGAVVATCCKGTPHEKRGTFPVVMFGEWINVSDDTYAEGGSMYEDFDMVPSSDPQKPTVSELTWTREWITFGCGYGNVITEYTDWCLFGGGGCQIYTYPSMSACNGAYPSPNSKSFAEDTYVQTLISEGRASCVNTKANLNMCNPNPYTGACEDGWGLTPTLGYTGYNTYCVYVVRRKVCKLVCDGSGTACT